MSEVLLNPPIVLIVTAVIIDEHRLRNFVYLLKSIAMQQQSSFVKLYVGMHVDVPNHPDFAELFTAAAGKRWECVKFKEDKAHFVQMQYLLEHKLSKLNQDTPYWVLFTHDDGLWHPLRVHAFGEHVMRVLSQPEHKVSCIACPELTYIKTNDHLELASFVEVDTAIARGQLRIAARNPDEPGALELYNICIPLKVLREFFNATHNELWCNAYADVALCDWLMEYGHQDGWRTVLFKVDAWTYMWRRAHAGYKLLSGSQISQAAFLCRRASELVLYMDVLAQMSCIHSMRHIVKDLFDAATRGQPADIVAMLEDKLERNKVEKPWVKK